MQLFSRLCERLAKNNTKNNDKECALHTSNTWRLTFDRITPSEDQLARGQEAPLCSNHPVTASRVRRKLHAFGEHIKKGINDLTSSGLRLTTESKTTNTRKLRKRHGRPLKKDSSLGQSASHTMPHPALPVSSPYWETLTSNKELSLIDKSSSATNEARVIEIKQRTATPSRKSMPSEISTNSHEPSTSSAPNSSDEAGTPRTSTSSNKDSHATSEDVVWGDILEIPDGRIIAVALEHLIAHMSLEGEKYGAIKVVSRLQGSYNAVHIIEFPSGQKFTVRVPAAGRPGRWSDDDAFAFKNDALTMQYIKRKSGLLMPEVIAFRETCENQLGHPYMVTTFLEGKPLYLIWDDLNHADIEIKRQKLLRSIAFEISKMRCFTWVDSLGALDFSDGSDNPYPGRTMVLDEGFLWEEDWGVRHQTSMEECMPRYSIIEYRTKLAEVFMKNTPAWCDSRRSSALQHGETYFLSHMINVLPDAPEFDPLEQKYAVGSPEWILDDLHDLQHTSTTLAPPDFNIQNILVDDDCNVTGFLDWDRVQVVPCYRGWARYPRFLYTDWHFQYNGASESSRYSPMELERYRNDYARYMKEAMTGQGDCKYTSKSHLYETLFDAVSLEVRREDFVDKILHIVLPRVPPVDFLERYGGEEEEEEMLSREEMSCLHDRLKTLFEPVVGPDDRFCF